MEVSKEIFDTFLSNFSGHSVLYKGVMYKTAEHAYHCQRYADPVILSEIQSAENARDAWSLSQKYKNKQFPNFNERKRSVMKEILKAKLEQHKDVRQTLLATGNSVIVKDEPKDVYWGTGPDGNGQNELGRLWMEIRTEIRSSI